MAVAKQIVEDISEAKMKSKSRSSTILRFLSYDCFLIILKLRFSNVSIPSHILVLAFPVLPKANSYFKQFSSEAVSYFSKQYW
ncbi:hypothetical protein P3S68_016935 [Capsicum galapagoense]